MAMERQVNHHPEGEHTGCQDQDEDHQVVLTKEIVRDHLSVLGKNPYTLSYIFTTASLQKLLLTDLDAIREFPHLQHVICSHNNLKSLGALQDLQLLLSVDASHNQLTQALDFDTPKCTPENAWVHGGEWIGSMVRRADLSHNCISSIRELGSSHPFLQELYLPYNDIKEIQGIQNLRFLRVLDLSHNSLTNTKGLVNASSGILTNLDEDAPGLEALEVLRLSHNQITSIEEVVALPRLTELAISRNKLTTLSCLENCYQLQKLNVASNELCSVNELNYLIPLPFLQQLVVVGCPFQLQEDSRVFYRARVLRRLQQLVQLDGEDASAKEKIKALAMHGSEVASRKQVLAKYLPSDEFVNCLPSLEFEEDVEIRKFYEERYGQRPEGYAAE